MNLYFIVVYIPNEQMNFSFVILVPQNIPI